jgi:hypothetical protein
MKYTTLTAASVIAATCGIAHAGAFPQFTAVMSGVFEVPPNDSPALGTMIGTYDAVANTFSFSWEITDNLIGMPASPGAHIHNAPPGVNGPVVFGFNEPDGTWPLVGNAVWTDLSPEMVDELFAGNLYLNFHTTAFPAGEIRGRIVPTPGAVGILAGAALMGLRRRRHA